MAFSVIPAIDVTGGRLGAFTPEGPRLLDPTHPGPVEAAARFVAAGARWVHVVDMDLAFGAVAPDTSVVASIAALDQAPSIQASGQLRTVSQVSAFLAAGAARVVVGSAVLGDEEAAAAAIAAAGGRAIVGLDVDEGRIRSRGAEPVDLDLMLTAGWLRGLGVPGFIVTAVARVGTSVGPDVTVIRRVARAGLPVIAAGGIATIADLRAARDAGAVGAVVGRAALDGTLDLAEALAWAAV